MGGLVVERGITSFILRGLGTCQRKNHPEGSGGIPGGKLIPRGLRDFPRGNHFNRSGGPPRGK